MPVQVQAGSQLPCWPVQVSEVPCELHFHVPHRPQGPPSASGQQVVFTQAVPHAMATPAHLQRPVVGSQVWLAGQTLGTPALHVPPLHLSPLVHLLPRLQSAVLLTATHPSTGSQLVVVHALLVTAHAIPAPGAHLPSRQVSLPLHTFLSSQSVSTEHWAGGEASVPLPAAPPVADASTLLDPPALLPADPPPVPAPPPLPDAPTLLEVNSDPPHDARTTLPNEAPSAPRTMYDKSPTIPKFRREQGAAYSRTSSTSGLATNSFEASSPG